MRIVLENSWRRVELMDRWEEVGPWEPGARTLTLLPAGESARQFLSRFLQDGKVMSALRMMLRWRTESASLAGRNGHGVLDEICRRLALGDFLLVQFELRPRPYLTTPAEPAPAPPPPAAPAPIPPAEPPAQQTCSNPACKSAFKDAADNGTPLVDADSPGCGSPKPSPATATPSPAPSKPPRQTLQCTNPGIKTAFENAAQDGTPLVECGEHCQC